MSEYHQDYRYVTVKVTRVSVNHEGYTRYRGYAKKRGRPKGSKDKELRKRRQKATGGGDTTATGN